MYSVFIWGCEIPNKENTNTDKIIILTSPPFTLKLLYFSVFESKVYSFIYWFWLILLYNKANAHC
jgi:hypothetical protein